MDARYNLSKLFSAAFGINSPIFITEPLGKKALNTFDYKGIGLIEDYYTKEATSWMGTPIIGLLKFKSGTYKIYNSTGILEDIEYNDFVLPPATLFSFRRSKNITKTNLLGNNGTVKEIFGFDDWVIDVKGLAVDTPQSSARDQLIAIKEWEELASAISVSGKLFTIKNIHAVVMDDYKEESIQGSPGIIPFSMTLTSDDAVELILPDVNENF
ncbi:DUF6046 domain-containing protein [Flavobacterium sp. LB2P74]|jgi:hypothetical protein|uniref:DUF6046 domain-containing protein n=1 Tax=Flavobacterium sp. LB2P74 TaxID=3401717 RepID=UPI003AAF3D54